MRPRSYNADTWTYTLRSILLRITYIWLQQCEYHTAVTLAFVNLGVGVLVCFCLAACCSVSARNKPSDLLIGYWCIDLPYVNGFVIVLQGHQDYSSVRPGGLERLSLVSRVFSKSKNGLMHEVIYARFVVCMAATICPQLFFAQHVNAAGQEPSLVSRSSVMLFLAPTLCTTTAAPWFRIPAFFFHLFIFS